MSTFCRSDCSVGGCSFGQHKCPIGHCQYVCPAGSCQVVEILLKSVRQQSMVQGLLELTPDASRARYPRHLAETHDLPLGRRLRIFVSAIVGGRFPYRAPAAALLLLDYLARHTHLSQSPFPDCRGMSVASLNMEPMPCEGELEKTSKPDIGHDADRAAAYWPPVGIPKSRQISIPMGLSLSKERRRTRCSIA